MKNLPNWLKWLIVIAALGLCIGLLYYTNLRNGQAEMPPPDWFTTLSALA